MTDRTDSLRKMVYEAPYEICIERAKFYTKSYEKTETLHPTIRAAKALELTLKNLSIFILDKEQIVGHRTSKILGAILPVERGDINNILPSELEIIKNRKSRPFHISEDDERYLFETVFPYWKGKTVSEKKIKLWKDCGLISENDQGLPNVQKLVKSFGQNWVKKFLKILGKRSKNLKYLMQFMQSSFPIPAITILDDQGHLVMGHNNLVKFGYGGIKKKALNKINELKNKIPTNFNSNNSNNFDQSSEKSSDKTFNVEDLRQKFKERFSIKNGNIIDKIAFLEAIIICCDSANEFIKKYGNLAEEKAKLEKNETRSFELKKIAKICSSISVNPPKNFREAIQLLWFNEIIANISHGFGGILAVGRLDQYLYPFYKKDIQKGNITTREIVELIEELIIKLSSNLMILPSFDEAHNAPELGTDHLAITVGGVDRNGNDATNELSYLICDAIENVRCMTISFSARIAPGITSREWLERVIKIYTKTNGTAIYNDNIIIPALINSGCNIKHARDYGIVGCVEPSTQGNAFPITAGNAVSLTGLFEMLLNDGYNLNEEKIPTIKEFNSKKFTTYEELFNTFKELINIAVNYAVKLADIKDFVYATNYPNPYISMTIKGCLENALDMTQGGAIYNFNTLSSSGIATVANSLAAIKKLVFEDKEMSLEELIDILHNNYKDNDILRIRLKNKFDKFGNDIDYVDLITKDLLEVYCNTINNHNSIRADGQFRPCLFSAGTHILTGLLLGATPDGREAGEPVSNSLSPSNNTEKKGPTAVLNSIAKLNTKEMGSGMSLNLRLLPYLIESRENRSKLLDLVLGYFEKGGMHVQFNIVSQETLIDAQQNPSAYNDLIVRVSGYNAYFAYLDKGLQEDIIKRCQFNKF
jgi:formate C-acetyltransferase